MKLFLWVMALSALIVPPSTAAETVDAVWMEQEVDFTFMSLEVAYSCDVLEARMEMLLSHVGAADVHVTVPACGGFKQPQKHHRVLARFATLVPANEGDIEVVKAAWREVELGKRHPRSIDDHDCEVLEQFQKHLLPTIEHEVTAGMVECSATKRSVAGRLTLKVLGAVAEDVAAQQDQ